MHTFKDSKGRSWQIELNCDNVEAVKSASGINVLDIEDPESELLKHLIEFPPMCCGIVEALVADQLATLGVVSKDFRQAMNGDAIGDALEGLRAELVNFSPRSRRPLLKAVQEKQRAVEASGIRLALESLSDPKLLEAAEAQLRAKLQEHMDQILSPAPDPRPPAPDIPSAIELSMPATRLPESSDSIQADSPGANSA